MDVDIGTVIWVPTQYLGISTTLLVPTQHLGTNKTFGYHHILGTNTTFWHQNNIWAPAQHFGYQHNIWVPKTFGHQHNILGTNTNFGTNTIFGHQHNIVGTNTIFGYKQNFWAAAQNFGYQINICFTTDGIYIKPASCRSVARLLRPQTATLGADFTNQFLIIICSKFYVRVTVHRKKFLYNKTN